MQPRAHARLELVNAQLRLLSAQPRTDHALGEISQLERILEVSCGRIHSGTLPKSCDQRDLEPERHRVLQTDYRPRATSVVYA